jgi:hypothetical protein
MQYNTGAPMLLHAVIISDPTGFKTRGTYTTNDVVIVTNNQTWLHGSPIKPLNLMPNNKYKSLDHMD